MKLLARIISLITNPVFVMLPIPYFLVLRETNDQLYALRWMIYSAVFIAVVGGFVWVNVIRGKFSDFDVSKREQRPLLFFACIVVCLWYVVGLLLLHGPVILFFLVASIIFSILIISFVNTRIKASIHVATISAVITAVSIIHGEINFFVLSFIPLIGWSRVKIKRHSLPETVVGGITGCLLTIGVYVIIKYLFRYSL